MTRIFITGGSGLLGSNICVESRSRYDEVYSNYYHHEVFIEGVHFLKLDLSNVQDCKQIAKLKPDYVIHCAALTNLDRCEQNPDEALRHNITATANICASAASCKSKLIHISTDSVFDGKKGNYSENDETNPVNNYARTKLESEKIVIDSEIASIIVRTNMFGWNLRNKHSLAEWMLDKLEKGQPFSGIKDVYFTPLLVNDIAEMIFELINRDFTGVIHLGSRDSVSKLEFAHLLANIFEYDSKLISETSIDDMNFKTIRPKNTTLNTRYAKNMLNHEMPSVFDNILRMKYLCDSGFLSDLKSC